MYMYIYIYMYVCIQYIEYMHSGLILQYIGMILKHVGYTPMKPSKGVEVICFGVEIPTNLGGMNLLWHEKVMIGDWSKCWEPTKKVCEEKFRIFRPYQV